MGADALSVGSVAEQGRVVEALGPGRNLLAGGKLIFESSLIVPTLLYYFYSKYIFESSNSSAFVFRNPRLVG